MIYFIQSTSGGPIKIGTTTSLAKRFRQLTYAHKVELRVLAVVEGGRTIEREMHDRFARLRVHGEWFEAHNDLLEYIASNGKPWGGSDQIVTVKIHEDAFHLARQACAFTGEPIVDFMSRLILEGATPIVEAEAEKFLSRHRNQVKEKSNA